MKLLVEKRRKFPDPKMTTVDGIVAFGDDLDVDTLLEAYSFGIFPWPHPDLPCLWFCPEERGVLDFKNLHVSRSLEKLNRKNEFEITYNKDFPSVIRNCSLVKRPGQDGTWITLPIIKAYEKFHQAGYAYSVEAWKDGKLVGGLYGVYVAGCFSAESMFFKVSNASKICLLNLVLKLKSLGFSWIDIQMITPITESFGGKYISKSEYLKRLSDAKKSAKPIVLK